MVESVLGEITAESLGFTLMHEHLYLGNWNLRMADPLWLDRKAAMDMIKGVIGDAKKHGVDTIVDATPPSFGRDMDILVEASEETGMQIIASTGVLADESGCALQIEEDMLFRSFVRDLTEDVGRSGARCGIIKAGTDRFGFTPINIKQLRACGRAQKETGVPIITHCRPANTRQGLYQLDIFEEVGANLEKVVIGHFRNGDPLDYAINVIRRGACVAIDQMNFNNHQLEHNLRVISELCNQGLSKNLILSHDACIVYNHTRWSDWDHKQYINYAPDSLSHISRVVLPRLRDMGVSSLDLHQIFYDNPRRLFTK